MHQIFVIISGYGIKEVKVTIITFRDKSVPKVK